jgi:hypothetical protein
MGREGCLNQDFQDFRIFRIMGDDGLVRVDGIYFAQAFFLVLKHP